MFVWSNSMKNVYGIMWGEKKLGYKIMYIVFLLYMYSYLEKSVRDKLRC